MLAKRRFGGNTAAPDLGGLKVDYPTFFYTPGLFHRHHGDMLYRSVARKLHGAIARFRPDLIYATWAYPDTYAASRMAEETGLPIVAKVHGSDIHSVAKPLLPLSVAGLNRCAAVVSVSRQLADMAVRAGVDSTKIHTIYNGVRHERFFPADRDECRQRLGLDLGDRIVLYVGNLVPVKRVSLIISAFGQVKAARKRLILVGSGPLASDLRSQAEQEELPVTFKGTRSHAELALWMNAADLLVLFSEREGVPNVVLEAMACGTPVVVSSAGGIPEVVKTPDCGEIVATSDVDDLAGAMDRVLEVGRDRDVIVRHARQFSWEANISQLIEVFSKTV